jgi:hypothetical protein
MPRHVRLRQPGNASNLAEQLPATLLIIIIMLPIKP